MKKKEYYKHRLPHFQQPGQAYFVTWSLSDAIPRKALMRYSKKLEQLKNQIIFQEKQHSTRQIINKLKSEYSSTKGKYLKAYNNLLHTKKMTSIDLMSPRIIEILKESFHFWEQQKLENFAYCIMPNHIHWVFGLYEKDQDNAPVYLQDILYSVKRFSANKINKHLKRRGTVWQKESFDTTIRDNNHLYYAIKYTLNNPVKARFVKDWKDWPGCWCF